MTRFLAGLLAFAAAFSQSPPPAFEVASVKLVEETRGTICDFSSSGPRVRYVAYAVVQLVTEAYNLKPYQVNFAQTAAPPHGWQDGVALYDIQANAPGDGVRTRDEFRTMLQALMADRFKLKVHREMKEMPVYALVVAKDGPKFKESEPGAVKSVRVGVNGPNQNITASKQTMDALAGMIPNNFAADRPVVNQTGLTGTYDFKIEAAGVGRSNNDPDPKNISVFAAVQQQLGLKLLPQKDMVEVLIIDHVEKPSAN